jgi:HD-like signal output (HDOD) protein
MVTVEALTHGITDVAPLPKAYVRIQQLVNDPNSSLHAVTQVISHDTGLTSRVLRIANSAYLGLVTKVDTIARAVQVLGLNQVHDLALATAAVGSLFKVKTETLDIYEFWRRSVYCGVAARFLAKECKIRAPERLFVAGLLHDVGHLVLAHREPELYVELLEQSIERQLPLFAVEQKTLGFDYAELGAELLTRWQLPADLIAAVGAHTDRLKALDTDELYDAAIIHVAAVIARAAMWRSNTDEPVPEFSPIAVQLHSVNDELVEATMSQADDAIVEAMTLLMPKALPRRRKAAAEA